jgi:hypothetical protein
MSLYPCLIEENSPFCPEKIIIGMIHGAQIVNFHVISDIFRGPTPQRPQRAKTI